MLVFHGTYIQLYATWWFPNIDFNPEGGEGLPYSIFQIGKRIYQGDCSSTPLNCRNNLEIN